jgi:RNA polymerase sigma-70 factor (ECF subfamily)
VTDALAEAFRDGWGRIVATLVRSTGDWDLAEEATAEAFALAVPAWRRDGVPDRPLAWLTTTARNRALDRLRRDRVLAAKLPLLAVPESPEPPDDRLALIFTCCHPALAFEARVALALRTLFGLSVPDLARLFLVNSETLAKRLVRARHKITTAGIPYRVPPEHLLPERTAAVLGVIYLLYTEGYTAPTQERRALAVRLSTLLHDLMPDEPEVDGLHALLLLHSAREAARLDPDGVLVPLESQDRTRWDAARITTGLGVLRRAAAAERLGPYQLQALIAACHATAPHAAATDWARIVRLYDQLLLLVPSDTVRLNRAVAVAMRSGPSAGLELLTFAHPFVPAVRADLLRRLGRLPEAAREYAAALVRTEVPAERAYLRRRLEACTDPATE